jgi:hypothetical protein
MDFRQIDGLKDDAQESATSGQVLTYNDVSDEFEPQTPVASQIIFRRAMLLMGS